MIIESLFAQSFGKLKDTHLSFEKGLNVITGANESGKSSLARFIRFMLYGFTSPRSSLLSENDKKRFTPWDEPVCRGSLEISAAGTRYTLRREQASRASFSVTDADGTPAFSGCVPGEALLGVNADTFDKTAFIGAGDVFFDDPASLSAAIKNMVFSADSTLDSDAALKRLDTLRRSILGKTARSGKLYEARGELAALINRQTELTSLHRELLGAEASLARVRAKLAENNEFIERLEKESANIAAFQAYTLSEKLKQAEQKVADCRAQFEEQRLALTFDGFLPDRTYLAEVNRAGVELESADARTETMRAELAAAADALQACYGNARQMKFNSMLEETGKSPEELSADIACLQSKRRSYRKYAILCACLFFLLLPIPFALYFHLRGAKLKRQLEELAARFGCTSLEELELLLDNYHTAQASAAAAKQRHRAAEDALERAVSYRGEQAMRLCALLDKTGLGVTITDTSELTAAAEEHIRRLDAALARLEALERALTKEESVLDGLAQSAGNREALAQKAAAYDASLPLREADKVARELDFYRRANEGLSVQEREFEKKAAVIAGNVEKPDELAAKINALSAEIAEMEQKQQALDMAIDAIEKAHETMRGNVSPLLTRGASAFFERMTDGKYKGLYVANDLSLAFLEAGSAEYRSVDYLSSGALDAAYLALRITLAEYLYREPPVLVFDDAFARFDDQRLQKGCELLGALAETYQVLVLSCQNREAQMLAAYGANHIVL